MGSDDQVSKPDMDKPIRPYAGGALTDERVPITAASYPAQPSSALAVLGHPHARKAASLCDDRTLVRKNDGLHATY
jgi:hypothetical protein